MLGVFHWRQILFVAVTAAFVCGAFGFLLLWCCIKINDTRDDL